MPDESPLQPRFVIWRCDHCRNGIEFDAVQLGDRAGCRAPCPHCGQETNLQEPPPPPPPVPDEVWSLPAPVEIPPELEPEKTPVVPPLSPPPIPAAVSKSNGNIPAAGPPPLAPKPIAISLPPDPLPPTHTRGLADARWLTDLGVIYFRQHQFDVAFQCFSRAAQQGFATAQFCLAVCYFNGHGTARNEPAAIPWLHQAAAQADTNAEFTLGLAYSLGRGVAPDAVLADQWLRQAAAHGHPEAILRIRQLTDQLLPAQPANLGPGKKMPPPAPAGEPPSPEKTIEKRRHDLQRLVLGLFGKK